MWMTDVMFILSELADDTTLLDGRIKELGSEDGVTKEIILFSDPSMLVIIGIEVFNIGTVLLIDKLTVPNGEMMVELSDATTEIKVGAELCNKMSVLIEIILLSVGTTVPNAAVLFNGGVDAFPMKAVVSRPTKLDGEDNNLDKKDVKLEVTAITLRLV